MTVAINKILNLNLKTMKNWSDRKNDYRIIKKCRLILNIISGNNITAMLQTVLKKKEKEYLNKKYKDALMNLSQVSNNSKQKIKHNFIRSLKQADLTQQEAKALNFNFSSYLWNNCLNSKPRHPGKIRVTFEYKLHRISTNIT